MTDTYTSAYVAELIDRHDPACDARHGKHKGCYTNPRVAALAHRLAVAETKLLSVSDLAHEWNEAAGDYVPPLRPDLPYDLMVDHSRALFDILGEKP